MLFDQRGCGKSTPHASLEDNTTWHLVADIEQLREHLGIERWQVFGGSWGSTLALAYAADASRARHRAGAARHLPAAPARARVVLPGAARRRSSRTRGRRTSRPIPLDERGDMIARLLPAPHERRPRRAQCAAAQAWSIVGRRDELPAQPSRLRRASSSEADFAAAFARIECHYFVNRGFFERDDQLLDDVDTIRHIPA